MKKWIIALVLILAVVIVFVACKGNDVEEPSTQPTIESTTDSAGDTESNDDELELIPGDDLVISDEDFNDENAIVIGGGSSDNAGEDSIDWSEIKGKKS